MDGSTADGATTVSPEQALEVVCDHLREELQLGDETIDPTAELDLLPGADSVRLMRVVADLEREFGIEFDDDKIREADTVADLRDLLLSGLRESGDRT